MFSFNGVLAIPGVAIAAMAGVLTTDAMALAGSAVPGMIVGLALGRALRSRVGDRTFARGALALLITSGSLGIATAAVGIL